MNRETSLRQAGTHVGDALDAGADCLVTPCPLCHLNLDMQQPEAAKVVNRDLGLAVLHLPQLVGLALGFEPKELGHEPPHRLDRVGRRAARRRSRLSDRRCSAGHSDDACASGDAARPLHRRRARRPRGWRGARDRRHRGRPSPASSRTRDRLERATGSPAKLNWFIRADPQIAAAGGDAGLAVSPTSPPRSRPPTAPATRSGCTCTPGAATRTGGWPTTATRRGWPTASTSACAPSASLRGGPPPTYRGGDRFLTAAVIDRLRAAGRRDRCDGRAAPARRRQPRRG